MEESYIIERLKVRALHELPDAIADVHAGEAIDICEHLKPRIIDKTTDTPGEFIEAIEAIRK
jgi:hypothetical protein